MTTTLRRLLSGLALAVLVVLVGMLIEDPEAELATSVARSPSGRAAEQAPGVARPVPVPVPASGSRSPLGVVVDNPFAVSPWPSPALRAAVAVPMAAASAPATPPLPFVYVGQLQEQGRTTVFLGQGGRTHLVHTGDVVGDYRVVAISATAISLLHVALQQQQSLSFGSSQ